ncbi:leucine-rich repeat-containing protein 43 isoform X2 [Lingula anatina]|uniref:Leucine-rich repeat-containing protein 43 isoform X2 n=1 Tax=Lingula anatina TaxID=7574 RepID=A0A1S3ITC6_LINAN|nr:leucine-rich repeat-containing protein 43 isoform X2 [Lingula anatina]|eukprot:XP_013401181.1 leucine-rich repeat-containing protein 43 isoform X2 [Lingula anatina]
MASMSTVPAFDAFQDQLRTLCLKEFPCGIGTWREVKPLKTVGSLAKPKTSKKEIQKPKQLPEIDKVNSRFSITLKDYGAQNEKTETLEEYVITKHSPWNLDYSWSDEAKDLRELAVRSPWLIDNKFIYNYFNTLRIIDKGVTEIDENLLNFTNLEELTLTANLLCQVNSKNLPRSLKVLELCANQICDLFSLCVDPPPLHHLGLGYNQLTYLDEYMTGDYWPQLLSLDLSHNTLSDLVEVVRKLSTLPKLRNLVLHGNPLCVIPGYRGYVIDSLKKLFLLDDIRISADERHHFKGLAKRKEFILDEAKFTFEVKYIKGVPMPEEMKNPEEQPEFPIIERKYYVQFMFLEDKASKAEIFQIAHEDYDQTSSMQGTDREGSVSGGSILPADTGSKVEGVKNTEQEEKNVNFASTENQENSGTPAENVIPALKVTSPLPDDNQSLKSGPGSMKSHHSSQAAINQPKIPVAPIMSESGNWAEEISLNWSQMVTRDDLVTLRDFLKEGMEIFVMEEKILSYPVEEEEGSRAGSAKGGKGEKKDKKKEEKKDEKGKDKGAAGKGDPKKGKKKGEPEQELRHLPPEYTTLARFIVPLEDFLEGEFVFENVYMKESSDAGSKSPSNASETKKDGKKDGKGRKDSAKKKDKDAGKATNKTKKSPRDGGKSPKGRDKEKDGDKKDAKGKAKGDKAEKGIGDDEEEVLPPPPLEVHVAVWMHHWKTAMDSIREEEERNKRLEEEKAAAAAAAAAAEEAE